MLAHLHFSVTCFRCRMKHYLYDCSFNYMSSNFIKIVLQYNSDYTDVTFVNMSFSVVYYIIVCNAPFCHYNQNSSWAPYLSSFSSAFIDVLNDLKSTYFALRDHLVNAWCIMVSHSDIIVNRFCMVNVDKSTLINKIICNILRLTEIFSYNITMLYPHRTILIIRIRNMSIWSTWMFTFIRMMQFRRSDIHDYVRYQSVCYFPSFQKITSFPPMCTLRYIKDAFSFFYVYA